MALKGSKIVLYTTSAVYIYIFAEMTFGKHVAQEFMTFVRPLATHPSVLPQATRPSVSAFYPNPKRHARENWRSLLSSIIRNFEFNDNV